MMMTYSILGRFGPIVIQMSLLLVAYLLFIDNAPPVKFIAAQTFGIGPQAKVQTGKPGDTLYAHREFHQLREVTGMVSQRILRASNHEVVTSYADFPERFPVRAEPYVKAFPFVIPPTLEPGKYFYDVSISYKLNWIGAPVIVKLSPIFFEVIL